jgi:hypothetical protein
VTRQQLLEEMRATGSDGAHATRNIVLRGSSVFSFVQRRVLTPAEMEQEAPEMARAKTTPVPVEPKVESAQAERPPCLCGCGGYPKGKNARFIPGHDARYHAALKKAAKAEVHE